MKRNIITIMMALAALLMAQCKKQAEQQSNEPATPTMEVKVRVESAADKTEISATGVVTWKQGDKLYVVGETQGLLGYVSAKADGDPADFEGSITALTSAQTLRFYYVGDKSFTLDGSNYTFDLGSQDGSLAGIAAHNQLAFGMTTSTIAVGTIDFGTITMTSLMSIAHLSIKDGDAAVSGPVTVTGGFATSTFNAKTYGGTTLTGTADDITMAFATGTTSTNCYLALLPGTQTLTFTTSDGKTKTLAAKTIAANTFYNAGSAVEVAVTAPAPTHEYVDLGLPSGLLWATCNLGAEHPYDYGDYYQWGGVTPVTSTSINVGWANCPGNGGSPGYDWNAFYAWKAEHVTGNVLNPEVDAARANWGEPWRMPTGGTLGDWQELVSNTYMEWVYDYDGKGVPGFIVYKVKDAEDKGIMTVDVSGDPDYEDWYTVNQDGDEVDLIGDYSLYDVHVFLPAAGARAGQGLYDAGSRGSYWSSTCLYGTGTEGDQIDLVACCVNVLEVWDRYVGYTVRPVIGQSLYRLEFNLPCQEERGSR